MIERKKGETHTQYIKKLKLEIQELEKKLLENKKEINNLITNINLIPLSKYEELLNKYNSIIRKLQNYGLWTGE